MIRKIFYLIVIASLWSCNNSQDYNLDFEDYDKTTMLPNKWKLTDGDAISIDQTQSYSGQASLFFDSIDSNQFREIAAIIEIPVELSAKNVDVTMNVKSDDSQSNQYEGMNFYLGIIHDDYTYQNSFDASSKWEEVGVTSYIPTVAKNSKIVIATNGKRKLWIDNIKIKVDGKDIYKIKNTTTSSKPLYNAQSDTTEFKSSSKINEIDLTQSNIDNLYQLGLIWGFLKYYHPRIADGEYNWDYELFRIMPKILSCKDANERDKILVEWIRGIGDFKTEKDDNYKISKDRIKIYPDLDWINNNKLSSELQKSLNEIKSSEKRRWRYYVIPTFGYGARFINETTYNGISSNDTGYRMLLLYRYWNAIQYFFPYKYLIGEEWKDVLKEFIPQFVNAKNEKEYNKAILKLIARINDAHSGSAFVYNTLTSIFGNLRTPLIIRYVEGKMIVDKIIDKEGKCGEDQFKIGDIILSINGRKVDDIVKEYYDLMYNSNHISKMSAMAQFISLTDERKSTITFERDKRRYTKEVYNISPSYIDDNNTNNHIYNFSESDIGYIPIGKTDIDKITKELSNQRGVIIDLREYPSVSMQMYANMLMPQKKEFAKFTIISVETPGLIYFDNNVSTIGKENKDYYKGKVVILINENTISQGEFTTMALRTIPNSVVIGSATAGADGNITELPLGESISAKYSSIGVYYPDGRETQCIGIIPDIEVTPTIKGIKEGRDELIEKAIEVINNANL